VPGLRFGVDGLVVAQPAKPSIRLATVAAAQIPGLRVGRIYTPDNMEMFIDLNALCLKRVPGPGRNRQYSVDDFDTRPRSAPSHPCSVMSNAAKGSHMARCGTLDPRRRYKMSHRRPRYEGWHERCLYIYMKRPIWPRGRKQQRRFRLLI
jgi:hypothetical protein